MVATAPYFCLSSLSHIRVSITLLIKQGLEKIQEKYLKKTSFIASVTSRRLIMNAEICIQEHVFKHLFVSLGRCNMHSLQIEQLPLYKDLVHWTFIVLYTGSPTSVMYVEVGNEYT